MDISRFEEEIRQNAILIVLGTMHGQKFLIDKQKWEDPAAWGILMCDLLQKISEMYGSDQKNNVSIVNRVMAGFHAEFNVRYDVSESD